ncbi:expressed protein [Phakopsora pachyrhizi]|uniref:Expressed protein n=1 Tax=Phakopsora pachyrhizi TaxID=170000 RepID=A0AAV0AN95_PHAPC|nr:expressed protein [Phakopsora pachyrhizi]CAH7668735.1 expressed protein [Phakopsora pachyrhizi]
MGFVIFLFILFFRLILSKLLELSISLLSGNDDNSRALDELRCSILLSFCDLEAVSDSEELIKTSSFKALCIILSADPFPFVFENCTLSISVLPFENL